MNISDQLSILFIAAITILLYKVFKNANSGINNCDHSHLTVYESLNEIKTRKRWLISFIIMSLISAISAFLTIIGDEGIDVFVKEIGIPLGIVLSIITVIPWFCITYHCSFKKRGTAWLSWTMVMLPMRELIDMAKGGWSNIRDWNALSWFFVVLIMSVEAYYLFNCFLLHKVNSIRNNKQFTDSAECSEYVLKIENTQTVSDLNNIYADVVSRWPQWEKPISNIYKKKKRTLERINEMQQK